MWYVGGIMIGNELCLNCLFMVFFWIGNLKKFVILIVLKGFVVLICLWNGFEWIFI